MKKLLLLPALLLAACAPTAAPVGPLAPGDMLTLTGTTKSKEAVNVTLTVRSKGERDSHGVWRYDADGGQLNSALVSVSERQGFVGVIDKSASYERDKKVSSVQVQRLVPAGAL